jgi:hypothetical protein
MLFTRVVATTPSGVLLILPKYPTAIPVPFSIINREAVASHNRGLPDFPALHFRDATENDLCVWPIDLQFKHASSGDLRTCVANGDQAKQCRAASQTPGTFDDIFKEESEGASI